MAEKKVLLVSVWVTILFASFGIVWGILADSGMIIFDGIYSVISVGLSILSLVILKKIQSSDDDERYPFGKAQFEPILIIFKSMTLIGMCTFSAINAFSELLAGGRDVSPGAALIYALVSTIGCTLVMILIQRKNRELGSGLLDAEKNQWIGDLLLSAGVLVGFSIAFLLQDTSLGWIVPYADPGLVVLASGLFIVLPFKSFMGAAREITFYQTGDEYMTPVRTEVASIADELDAEYKLRMMSLGRELTIEVNFLVEDGAFCVLEMDKIRDRVAKSTKGTKKGHWLNVSFTKNPLWL